MEKFMNPFPENNDGAFYVLKGRFLMPLLGVKDGKTVSPVKVTLLAVAACLVVIGLFVGAQSLIANASYELPNLKALELGLSQEDVLQKLKEDELVPVSQDVYAVADGCKYAGVHFDVHLRFDDSNQLAGYEYTATLTATPEDAARTAAKVVNKLDMSFYGNHLHEDCLHIEKAALTEQFTAPYQLTYSRDITPQNNGVSATANYLQALEASDAWEHKVAGYVVKQAHFYNDVDVTYDPDTQQLTVCLNYTVDADRKSA